MRIMKTYRWPSPVGVFRIQYFASLGRWKLSINDEVLGTYLKDHQAADDVSSQATGYDKWDMFDMTKAMMIAPADLGDWESK